MNGDELELRLRGADDELARVTGRPPRVADLERRHRRQVLRRGAVLALCAAALATAHWSRTLLWGTGGARTGLLADAPRLGPGESLELRLDEHLASLDEAVSELRALCRRVGPVVSMESSALSGFRALRHGAVAGDPSALAGIQWIADRFPETHGGRCARAFLESAPATDASLPLNSGPRNER